LETSVRVRAARLKLSSDDAQVHYDARAKIARELRGWFDQMVLRLGRSMLVNDDSRDEQLEFTFTFGLIRACKRRVRSDGARSNVAVVAVGIAKGVR
jgi:hypothetical protein